jgi:chemotaxis protein MotB
MSQNGVEPTRLSVRGFGEYRPVAPNAANNKGNDVNRRVEMYIVPKGA